MKNQKTTSIIILTYNCLEYTKKCLFSIKKYTDVPYELIVVDNGSSDGTVEYLKQFSDINLIENKTNKGFSIGNNQGIKVAKGDYILLLNNDTIVTEGWLRRMISHFDAEESIGLIGPRTNNISGYQSIEVNYSDNLEDIQEFVNNYIKNKKGYYSIQHRLAGFCLLIKREVIEKIGLLDERFVSGNFEDDDYCLRARQAGFKCLVAEDVFIHHYGSKTFEENKINYYIKMDQNRDLFLEKWGFLPEVSKYYEYERKEIQRIVPKNVKRLLDVGCAAGTFGEKLKKNRDIEVIGIEISQEIGKIAQSRLDKVLIGDIETMELPFDYGYFDCITFNDVIEHLFDPVSVLKKLKNYLSDDGVIIASIPNFNHISVLQKIIEGPWKYEESGILDKTHLHFFTGESIEELFISSGFVTTTWREVIYEEYKISNEFFLEGLKNIGLNVSKLDKKSKVYQYIVVAVKEGSKIEKNIDLIHLKTKKNVYWKGSLINEIIVKKEYNSWIFNNETTSENDVIIHCIPPERLSPDINISINIGRIVNIFGDLSDITIDRCKSMDQLWVSHRKSIEKLQNYGIIKEKLFYLPLLIDFGYYSKDFIKEEKESFCFLSIIEWKKLSGWRNLISEYLSIFSPKDNVSLIIAIDNRRSYVSLSIVREQINSYINRLGYDSKNIADIVLIEKPLLENLPNLFKSTDVFIHPVIDYTGLNGYDLILSMSYGVPIIIHCDQPFDFLDTTNCFFFKENNLKDLLIYSYNNRDELRVKGEISKKYVYENHSLDNYLKEIVDKLEILSMKFYR